MAEPTGGKGAKNKVLFERRSEARFKALRKLNEEIKAGHLRDNSEIELQLHLEHVEQLRKDFCGARSSLEELDFNEIENPAREDFDTVYRAAKALIQTELARQGSGSSPCSSTLRQISRDDSHPLCIVSPPKSRLPEIRLPTFAGAYTDWTDFFSTFSTIVHTEADLTNVERFQHLRSCLKGVAFDTIRSLEINDANYLIAIELLKNRFDNKRLIFQAHIREIFGIKGLETNTVGGLRELCDHVNSHMRALQSMSTQEQIADNIMIQLVLQRLDSATQTKWEETSPLIEIPSWSAMLSFLERRCQTLETVEHALVGKTPSLQVGKYNKTPSSIKRSFFVSNTNKHGCLFCDDISHLIYNCTRFANLSPTLRLREAKKLALCINCLKKGHRANTCKSGPCKSCHAKHHTLLHFNTNPSTVLSDGVNGSGNSEPAHHHTFGTNSLAEDLPSKGNSLVKNEPTQLHTFVTKSLAAELPSKVKAPLPDVVLLATAVILIKNRTGAFVPCRALLDSGSQLNLITNRLVNFLQLKKIRRPIAVSGIGNLQMDTASHIVDCCLSSRLSEYSVDINATIVSIITDEQPTASINISNWNLPSNIKLADPLYYKPQRIDLLIGASLFFELLCVGQIHLSSGLPLLQKTRFGWIISGGGYNAHCSSSFLSVQGESSLADSAPSLDDLVKRFWEIESFGEPNGKLTNEELDCEHKFNENFKRLASGEYSVRLPISQSIDLLGNSYQQALHRFQNLERKLERNQKLKADYSAFIREYIDLKHMSLVDPAMAGACKYFLPHHCVIKSDSSTTKLRVVFDGSAATTTGYSLNDLLMAGPTIQPKLFQTLLRFRTFPIALTGDICKMYRCVRVSSPDNYLQCILWRNSPQEKINIFSLDTVTYGTKSASFLAIRAMHQLAFDESEEFPIGAENILKHFYVDDMITGGNTPQIVTELMKQTSSLLCKGGFKLRKFCSNSAEVLREIPTADRELSMQFCDSNDMTKALGLMWEPAADKFLFLFSSRQIPNKCCKRSVLSTIARLYDPLGLIGPIITKAKIFLQHLWRERLQWDESLSLALQTSWAEISKDIHNTQEWSFPRFVSIPNASVEIHAFCDASLDAYGVCVYVRASKDNRVKTSLLCSKSRVSPLKSLTIPKLELCAAAFLAQLISSIKQMDIFSCKYHCWSDSSVVLSWLRQEPSKFNVFVANRINNIQHSTADAEWHYVPTTMNPADILSKGASSAALRRSSLWLHGPEFLSHDRGRWPETCLPVSNIPELRKRVFIVNVLKDLSIDCKYVNSFPKMQRIYSYIYKFISRIRTSAVNTEELQHGTWLLLRTIQMSNLAADYDRLKSNLAIASSSSLRTLFPFMDSFGLIRVGGRLKNSTLDFESRHPIILPKHHPITDSIIMHLHQKHLHAGTQSLLAAIRLQYWPLGGRKTVARVINKCIICFRAKPKLLEHIMGDLPKDRFQATRAFVITGVDYCGPLYYKNEVRNKAAIKCYISLFICFSTKAVHLELVKDLSTSAFLAALKRFTCTRGKPQTIWSDNATNFVGARNELTDLRQAVFSSERQDAVFQDCLNDGINWKFIPPRSPHFGGLWEASVKIAKFHLYRSIGHSFLTFDELRTLICQVAAIINSRPLTPISENPDDLDVLTPAHFLIGAPFTSVVEPDVTDLNLNRLDRWQRVAYLQQVFWKRWSSEYLTLLQQRVKWQSPRPALSVGAMVLVKDENLPTLKWPLARVIQTIPGRDGISRVAVLQTKSGNITRAVTKLALLPIEDNVESRSLSRRGECLRM